MKYLRTLLLELQAMMQYRLDVLGWLIVGFLPSVTLVIVWFAILGDRQDISGFTKGDFIVYYLFLTIAWYIVGGIFAYPLATRVKNGTIANSLLKPYNEVLAQAIREQAFKIVSLIMSFPAIAAVIYFYHDIIQINLTAPDFIALIISLILGGLVFGLLEALVGLSAFWVTRVWPVNELNQIFSLLFGGRMAPLALMPFWVQSASQFLPYKYTFYTPVNILLNKSNNPFADVGFQLVFVLVLFAFYQFVWHLGIRKYEVVGG